MKYYIIERHNPQLKQPYYMAKGKISKKNAKEWNNTIYGTNVLLTFDTEQEYNDKLTELKEQGMSIR